MLILPSFQIRFRLIFILFCFSFPLFQLFPIAFSDNKWEAPAARKAAENIIQKINPTSSLPVMMVYSKEKQDLAFHLIKSLEERRIDHLQLILSGQVIADPAPFRNLLRDLGSRYAMVFLIHPGDAQFLFSVLGRPDISVSLPERNLFCDWLAPAASIVRTHSIDFEELNIFRTSLLKQVAKARSIRVTTQAGTDITFYPRHWKQTDGEIFTPLREGQSNGKIWVDGAAYGGPAVKPFFLEIREGRVINSHTLDPNDDQQKEVVKDLARDANANILAEFGVGINPGALRDKDVMEAEQSRGTCHFGFGNNIPYGGRNRSGHHLDLVVQKPIIIVDGQWIYWEGIFLMQKEKSNK